MRRREFITILGGGAVMPIVARAQERERMRRIGVLLPAAADDSQFQTWVGAFLQALALLGWSIGRNVRIDTRWATAMPRQFEVTRRNWPLSCQTSSWPMATRRGSIAADDPNPTDRVSGHRRSGGGGFVESLARPGGNATGFMHFDYSLSGKWLELLKEIAPSVTRVAVLRDPALASGIGQFAVIQAVAPSLRVEVNPVNMRDAGEIERAIADFRALGQWRPDRDGGRWRRSVIAI